MNATRFCMFILLVLADSCRIILSDTTNVDILIVPRGGQQDKEEEKLTFVHSLSATSKPSARISSKKQYHSITNQLKDHFSDASITLQKLVDSPKPLALHFMEEIRERINCITPKDTEIMHVKRAIQYSVLTVINHRPNDDILLFTVASGLCMIGTSIGYRSFLYFVSVGYSCAIGITILTGMLVANFMNEGGIPFMSNIHSGLVVLWSLRLTTFLLHREYINWPAWHWKLQEVHELSKSQKKRTIWLTCSLCYAMMTTPCLFRLKQSFSYPLKTECSIISCAGIWLQSCGLLIESVADYQKGKFKRKDGNRKKWCNIGLWSLFTAPNYLGEIIFWSGTYIAGLDSYATLFEWVLSTLGFVFLLVIVKGANESLNAKHVKNYSDTDGYLHWRKRHSFIGPKLLF